MPSTTASAPGKIILFGEHAVVYGQPAIAAPVSFLRAWARVSDGEQPGVYISAPDLDEEYWLEDSQEGDSLAAAIRIVQHTAQLATLPPLNIEVHSDIPIAGGLGSGAATAAALIRALAQHLNLPHLAEDDRVAELTYEVEKIHHGTPSGIDNTVVALEKPVYFVRRQPRNHIEPFSVARPLPLLIADTGDRSSTRDVVGDVRRRWQEDPQRFEDLFNACGQITRAAWDALQRGDLPAVGRLMNENHAVLQDMTVSSSRLDHLVKVARDAGALGAKLSGAGRGGNMITLVGDSLQEQLVQALQAAGARRVYLTTLQ